MIILLWFVWFFSVLCLIFWKIKVPNTDKRIIRSMKIWFESIKRNQWSALIRIHEKKSMECIDLSISKEIKEVNWFESIKNNQWSTLIWVHQEKSMEYIDFCPSKEINRVYKMIFVHQKKSIEYIDFYPSKEINRVYWFESIKRNQ